MLMRLFFTQLFVLERKQIAIMAEEKSSARIFLRLFAMNRSEMENNMTNYLKYIVEQIHTTVVATVDDEGHPVTAAIDMMDYDDNSLYFLTAKGKSFYTRLKKRGYLALTGMKGEDTMSSVAVSLGGKVRELGAELIPHLFEKNPYMNEIYPGEATRTALTVFQIYEGTGEWFDLSKKPIERASFYFNIATGTTDGVADETVKEKQKGYFVTDRCIGCKLCYSKCPQKCIDIGVKPVIIHQNNCLHCGNCYEICPARAIEKRG